VRVPPPVEGSFAASLPARERRLGARLEGFGDIVFGFAVSQCALQLPVSNGHVSVLQPLNLLFYFGTFALLASLWLIYHRLMSEAFKPAGIDLFLAFAYLAFVSLMPYAMYSITHVQTDVADARVAAIAEYSSLYAAMMGLAATIILRNLRRGWWLADEQERNLTWLRFVRCCVVFVVMTGAFTIDLTLGSQAASLSFFAIFPAMLLIRRYASKVPAPERLRIAGPVPAGGSAPHSDDQALE
jgi:uncharacterized membrane protein